LTENRVKVLFTEFRFGVLRDKCSARPERFPVFTELRQASSKWLINLQWGTHGCKVTAGASDFGDVRKPSPHEICIVSKIVGKQRISPMLLPITIEDPRINTE
jgi:hypothetical protein